MKLEGKSLKADFFRFVIPTLLSLLVYTLYATVDGIFVARGVDSMAVSAVNLNQPYSHFLFSVAILLAVGTSTLCAFFLGQKKQENANALFTQILTFILLFGAVITAAVLLLRVSMLRLLGATAETEEYLRQYLLGFAPFSVFFILSYFLEVLVKTDGYPQLATVAVTVGCLTNCVLDYLLIFVIPWGVFGAAFATGVSQLVVTAIYGFHFLSRKSTLKLTRLRFSVKEFLRLIPIGLPDCINEVCMGVMIFIYNRMILAVLGAAALVSYTIISYVATIYTNLCIGVSQGSQPLISYYQGKNDKAKTAKLLKYGFLTTLVMSLCFFLASLLLAPQIVRAYIPDTGSALFVFSLRAFRQYIPVFLVGGLNILLCGYFSAVEYPRAAILISLSRALILQAICLVTMVLLFGSGSLWLAAFVTETLCLIITAVSYLRYRKTRLSV